MNDIAGFFYDSMADINGIQSEMLRDDAGTRADAILARLLNDEPNNGGPA
ncbi:MAG: hypothetical protein ACPGO3_02055 [Magnetospiraceae bacterium]